MQPVLTDQKIVSSPSQHCYLVQMYTVLKRNDIPPHIAVFLFLFLLKNGYNLQEAAKREIEAESLKKQMEALQSRRKEYLQQMEPSIQF